MQEVVKEHRIKTSYLSDMLNVNPMFLMGRSYTDQEVVEILRGLDCTPSKLSLYQLRRIAPKLITAELGMKRPIFNEDRRPDWWAGHVPFVNVRQKPVSVVVPKECWTTCCNLPVNTVNQDTCQ